MTNTASPPVTILHIPHSSTLIPDKFRAQFVLMSAELERELLLMTDWFTDDLFALSQETATTIRFPVSRLLVDPERFLDDSREMMAAKGMGAIYIRTSNLLPLRRVITAEEREALIRNYYVPHHQRLTKVAEEALSAHGQCLIIDAHSFPSKPLPYEYNQCADRPLICIGTDEFHTPVWLSKYVVEEFRRSFGSVAINRPFSGALVPEPYLGKDKRVLAIMIEVNRALYMNEESGEKLPGFKKTADSLKKTAIQIIEIVRHRNT